MFLEIHVVGDEIIRRELMRFSGRMAAPEPGLELVADAMEDATMEQFESEGARSGEPWQRLSPSTVAAKAEQGLDPAILQATRRMVNSLTLGARGEHIRQIGPGTLRFGTRVPYAIYHQTGTRNMPRRPPLVFTEVDRRRFVKILQSYIMGAGGKGAGMAA